MDYQDQDQDQNEENMVTIPASALSELMLNVDRDFLSTFAHNNSWITPYLQTVGNNNVKNNHALSPIETFHYDSRYITGVPLFLEQLNKYFGHLFWDEDFTYMEAYFYRRNGKMYEDNNHIPYILAYYHTYQIETIFTLDVQTGEIRRIDNTVTNISTHDAVTLARNTSADSSLSSLSSSYGSINDKAYTVSLIFNENDQLTEIHSNNNDDINQVITIVSDDSAIISDSTTGWNGYYQYSSQQNQATISSDDPNGDNFAESRGFQFLGYYMFMIHSQTQ
jgi:hypothetical protein